MFVNSESREGGTEFKLRSPSLDKENQLLEMSYHSLFQFGMKGVVERYRDKKLKQQCKQSAHGALCDAKALGKICTGSYLRQNFHEFLEDRDGEINWEFQDLLRPSPRTIYLPG